MDKERVDGEREDGEREDGRLSPVGCTNAVTYLLATICKHMGKQ